ncbi:MAG: hypothetical protein JW913_14540 [Chitinispirillaceae bacterium]|nr:hypothetical protein [Chitinispirillaceae bacterium]
MSTFKYPLYARCSNVVKNGLCTIILTLIMVISSAINPLQKVQAATDEAMPASIPKEVIADWKDQGGTMEQIKASLPAKYADKVQGSGDAGFQSACHWRRVARMEPYPELETIMFCRHHNFGNIVVGYHDNVDAKNADQEWSSNSGLCLLNFKNYYSQFKEILTKKDAVIRDPCISFDAKKVVFAMSGSSKGTGYRLYEMEIDDPSKIKQLTENPAGLVVADFEPCYLPNGDIMFTSTRNFGLLDCSNNPTTNMFLMNGEGKYIRQIGFDQVHTFYPVLRPDGTVLYTRWEYNDRDVRNAMGLFQMNPDGCRQTEIFGNQTSWPMTLIHGRPIPFADGKFIAVASGHHGTYSGEVCIVDATSYTNGTKGVKMIAPVRPTKPRVQDGTFQYGGVRRYFAYPNPLSEDWFLVSYRSSENGRFKLYLMDTTGNRELLAWSDQSLSQAVLVAPWKTIWRSDPVSPAEQADYNDSMGECTMQDVYYGAGMEGVKKESGVAKSLRVVALQYRVQGSSGYGSVYGSGPSGIFTPAVFVPVSLYGGSWEAKEVLGKAKIYEDGSAAFKVPARRPFYFQVLDSNGCCIATMRSWATLMPGETFACVGCHESKLEAPPSGGNPMAGTPKKLDTPLGIENKPFDYGKLVQPILDKHCTKCHKSGHASGFDLSGDLVSSSGGGKSWTRSYISLMKGIGASNSNKAINIVTIFSQPEQKPPYSFGSTKSGMIKNILSGHKDVKLSATETEIIACWIDLAAPHAGTYSSYMSSSDASGYQKLEQKKEKWLAIEAENLKALAVATAVTPDDHGRVKSTNYFTEQRIGYLPAQRALVLKKSSQGNFMLVDLRGRVIFRMQLSDQHTDGDVTISLPASLGTGLYIARFEGTDGIRQAKISITQ